MIVRKTPIEIEKMRAAGRIVAEVLQAMEQAIVPGVTRTADLDALAVRIAQRHGATPAFLGYRGFPASTCISVNETVVHGIPGERVLQDGDIVSVDFACWLDGYIADAATTIAVGQVSTEARRLLAVTRESLHKGIAAARIGGHVGDIGAAVQRHVEKAGYSVVRDLVGHGVGKAMHEEPQVPNYGRPGRGDRLYEGMTIAIEPMVNAGKKEVRTLEDRWTVVTADGSLAAHFEHTVAITRRGPEILTLLPAPAPDGSAEAAKSFTEAEASVTVGV
jgi:methionyl aminopeptidase